MNDPVEFTTEDGLRIRMRKDEHGYIVVSLRVDDGRPEFFFYLTAAEAQEWINGMIVTNEHPVVGAWGWHHNRAIHIPSYNQGHADATGGVA
jgi:hypothetical protein